MLTVETAADFSYSVEVTHWGNILPNNTTPTLDYMTTNCIPQEENHYLFLSKMQ